MRLPCIFRIGGCRKELVRAFRLWDCGVFLQRRAYVDFHLVHRVENNDGRKNREGYLMEVGVLKIMIVELPTLATILLVQRGDVQL